MVLRTNFAWFVLKVIKLFLSTSMKTVQNDFTESGRCSQAQIILVYKVFESHYSAITKKIPNVTSTHINRFPSAAGVDSFLQISS
jgi:hypothetical protein